MTALEQFSETHDFVNREKNDFYRLLMTDDETLNRKREDRVRSLFKAAGMSFAEAAKELQG